MNSYRLFITRRSFIGLALEALVIGQPSSIKLGITDGEILFINQDEYFWVWYHTACTMLAWFCTATSAGSAATLLAVHRCNLT